MRKFLIAVLLLPVAANHAQRFYPWVTSTSDESFLIEQGILSPTGAVPTEDLLFWLVDKKGSFEWQQDVLGSWDGKTMVFLETEHFVERRRWVGGGLHGDRPGE